MLVSMFVNIKIHETTPGLPLKKENGYSLIPTSVQDLGIMHQSTLWLKHVLFSYLLMLKGYK